MIFGKIADRFLRKNDRKANDEFDNTQIAAYPKEDGNKIRELRNEVAKIEAKHAILTHSTV